MEFILDKVYTYEEIAKMVVNDVRTNSHKIIGITGTSSVGKSTFTKMIAKQLRSNRFSTQILRMDDYLKEKYRAENRFWNRLDSSYLKPEHFDWQRLKEEIVYLNTGKCLNRECYVRGIGWNQTEMLRPADYYIIEGLFMDSFQAAEYLQYDLLILLTADDRLIRELRTKRDAYYRENYKDFQRTESETQKEIENTLIAGKKYQKYAGWSNCLQLIAKGDYNARIEHIKR